MRVLLIPGFWLDASSWDEVAAGLRRDGRECEALTLPGLESPGVDRRGIALRDHVDAVVAAIDDAGGPVVLVGHSVGGSIAHAAADRRPDRVARIVYVDAVPLGNGGVANAELVAVDGEIPFPDWSAFEAEDLRDLDGELRDAIRARAIPQPARVATDEQVLTDERRYDIPATVIACEFSGESVQRWIARREPSVAELAAMRHVEYVDLPTGHWPQFTRPNELAQAISAAVRDQ